MVEGELGEALWLVFYSVEQDLSYAIGHVFAYDGVIRVLHYAIGSIK